MSKMKVALWVVFALLALLWTGASAALAQLIGWSGQALAVADAAPLEAAAAVAAVPPWLAAWVDPAAWAAAQQAVLEGLGWFASAMPALGAAVGWLVPAVWVVWGLGLAVMLGCALLVLWLITRSGPTPGAGPQRLATS